MEIRPQGLQANVIMYSASILTHGQSMQWQPALGLLEEMQSHGFQANVIACSATHKRFREGLVMAARRRAARGDAFAGSSSECDHVHRHHQHLWAEQSVAVRPRLVRGNAAAGSSGERDHVQCHHPRPRAGRPWQRALALLAETHSHGPHAHAITSNATISV